jgi:hypothetical protein
VYSKLVRQGACPSADPSLSPNASQEKRNLSNQPDLFWEAGLDGNNDVSPPTQVLEISLLEMQLRPKAQMQTSSLAVRSLAWCHRVAAMPLPSVPRLALHHPSPETRYRISRNSPTKQFERIANPKPALSGQLLWIQASPNLANLRL